MSERANVEEVVRELGSDLGELIDSEGESLDSDVETDDYTADWELPGVSLSYGGEMIGTSDLIPGYSDYPMYGGYLAFESPGLPSWMPDPGISTVVSFICSLIQEVLGGGSNAATLGGDEVGVQSARAIAGAVYAVIYSVGCSLVIEPIAYGVLDGNVTMAFRDDSMLDLGSGDTVPSIENGTAEEYNTDEPWDDIPMSTFLAPAHIEGAMGGPTQSPTIPGYDWGDIEEP